MMANTRWQGLGVFLAGVALYGLIIPLGVDQPSNLDVLSTGPRFWPNIIAGMLCAVGLALLLRRSTPIIADEDAPEASVGQRLVGLVLVLLVLFTFYLVIEHLGMVVPGMALIFLMAWFAGERRVLLLTTLSLGVPLGLYVFFVHIANIPIPLGWFESLRG